MAPTGSSDFNSEELDCRPGRSCFPPPANPFWERAKCIVISVEAAGVPDDSDGASGFSSPCSSAFPFPVGQICDDALLSTGPTPTWVLDSSADTIAASRAGAGTRPLTSAPAWACGSNDLGGQSAACAGESDEIESSPLVLVCPLGIDDDSLACPAGSPGFVVTTCLSSLSLAWPFSGEAAFTDPDDWESALTPTLSGRLPPVVSSPVLVIPSPALSSASPFPANDGSGADGAGGAIGTCMAISSREASELVSPMVGPCGVVAPAGSGSVVPEVAWLELRADLPLEDFR